MKNITQQQAATLTQPPTTLVLGGNGKTGRRIVDRLKAKGLPYRIGSRSGSPRFDWNDSSNWPEVLRDVKSLFIAYYPDLAVPGAPEDIRELAKEAKAQGVEKLVLLSGRGEAEAQLCERIVMHCGIPATVVRCAWFNQNFSESFLNDMVMAGTIALPTKGVREPFVDVEDIADVAFAALTEEGHTGKIYELTGPRLMTFEETAAEISRAIGREISFVEISNEDFLNGLKADELPESMVDLVDYLFREVLDGRNASLCNGVYEALGRPPRDFSDYVKTTHKSGAWAQTSNDQ